MRILIVNYRYFVSGGSERYMFNLTSLLEKTGHEVIPFSIRYSKNDPTLYSRYFTSPLAGDRQEYFREHTWAPLSLWKTLARAVYSREVYNDLRALIDEVRPDRAIVLQYLKKLSPSVLQALHDAGIPFIVRISDFGMVCPNAHLFREDRPCELCLRGSLANSVRFRCVQNSYAASTVNLIATKSHQLLGLFDLIPLFVVPSRFTLKKLAEGGISRERLVHLPTMVELPDSTKKNIQPGRIFYSGRIDRLKGIELLFDALEDLSHSAPDLDWHLRVAGMGERSYIQRMRERASDIRGGRIEFLGSVSMDDLAREMSESVCTVTPSLWYENMPNTVLESLAHATPVIVPAHGCFPEIVEQGRTGLLFEPGNRKQLAESIRLLLEYPRKAMSMGDACREYVRISHSPEGHCDRLLGILSSINQRRCIQ